MGNHNQTLFHMQKYVQHVKLGTIVFYTFVQWLKNMQGQEKDYRGY